MREDWEIKKLIDVCDVFTDGNWIESKDQSSYGIRLVQTGNIGFGFYKDKDEKARYISEETFIKLKCTEILPGDVLVSRLPDPVGKSCIIPDINSKMITGVDCTIIRTKEFLDPTFLCYYQMSNNYLKDVQLRVTGTTRSRISRKNLGLIEIPIPPLPEQHRIVSILDRSFAAIDKAKANTEQNLKNAKELFESYLQDLFHNGHSWKNTTLGNVCSLITDGKHGNCQNEEKSGFYFLSAKDVRNDTLLFENGRQITEKDFYETHQRTDLKQGDICIINTGATIGRMAFAPNDPRTYKTTFQKSVAVIKTLPEFIDNKFCAYLLKADLKTLVKISAGTAVPNLLLGDIKRHQIKVPSTIKEQKQIVQKLDELSEKTKKLEQVYQQKITNLDELKKSILQKAFRGEL
ncbi:MAG: hypothetical protein C0596_16190 [Marinilabiliales bacterium]|nr:MAG: hypothetical protein C0596_16190 [Marinilabiliales bacterium]